MENFELNFDFTLSNNNKVSNIALYDEKEIIDNADEIKIFGKLYIDLMFDNENTMHEKRDLNITLNKCKYNKKDIKVRINDYDYSQEDNILKLKVNYEVDGEDVPVSNFCFINNSTLENELRDFLSRNEDNNINLNDEKIVSFNFSVENEKLDQYLKDNNFDINTIKGGCYIASCVYGSYNTKEVWTLRRYRDYKLSKNLLGRLFIKIYYLISPLMLRMFSNQKWFISLNKKILDKFVNKLNKEGYESTPYKD